MPRKVLKFKIDRGTASALGKHDANHHGVAGGTEKCTPFVSAYSDCTEENKCTECHKCTCSADGKWECKTISENCSEDPDMDEDQKPIDDQTIDSALNEMIEELQENQPPATDKMHYAPAPQPRLDTSSVIGDMTKRPKLPKWDYNGESIENESIKELMKMFRKKRSAEENDEDVKNSNETVTFDHTVDEMDEDILKSTNTSGAIMVPKVDLIPVASRRSSTLNTSSTSLQIEYRPPIDSQHATDNKVDTPAIHDDHEDLLVHHTLYEIIGNQSQASRDKDLSKLVVNELRGGETEIIGEKDTPVISNITFTPENDTLTAMAFIAGNLLNKLWNMEKDGDDSLETENMKHKKINDLLELFKEPLNLRQETFLKNALQHLSTAIETKNIKNVSLCENIEELKKTSGIIDDPDKPKPIIETDGPFDKNFTTEANPSEILINKTTAAAAALNKIGNILELIQKFERTQNVLIDMKANATVKPNTRMASDNELTKDEQITLNVFGNILESLTKLLIPNSKSKKLTKGVKSKNLLKSDLDVKNKFKNLNLTDLSLTTKDKIVLDYLTHIQNNPNCLLNKQEDKPLLPKIEGDILLNLSEFFKIKSMSDLLKLVDADSKKDESIMRTVTTSVEATPDEQSHTTVPTTTTTTLTPTTTTIPKMMKLNNATQLEFTKAKLKGHLRNILEDVVELQNISGKSANGQNIEIAEALPCIYNLLNNKEFNKNVQTKTHEKNIIVNRIDKDPVTKITQIVNNLKKELNNTIKTRRNYVGSENRPKSAIVWERTLKNVGNKLQLPNRRNLPSSAPKSLEDIKIYLEKIGNTGSNTYKSIAYLAEIPAEEQLLLLKTLAVDTKKYIIALNDIRETIETVTILPIEDHKTISEFIENTDININLNGKVISKIDRPKPDNYLSNKEPRPIKKVNVFKSVNEKEMAASEHNTVKLTRDQIINQLIRNRMMFYLKLKQGTGGQNREVNVNLAKKILLLLEIGNYNLARELFKIFVSQNKQKLNTSANQFSDPENYETKQQIESRKSSKAPVPLIQFEDPKLKTEPWATQEQLMKQLMTMKNMKF